MSALDTGAMQAIRNTLRARAVEVRARAAATKDEVARRLLAASAVRYDNAAAEALRAEHTELQAEHRAQEEGEGGEP